MAGMDNSTKTPGERAIDILGGPAAVGRLFGVSAWAASKWRHRVPAERVIALEKATGVSRHELRPDIYPLDEHAA